MEAYNRKINRDGTYRPFHGYTVVSMVVDDLSAIEKFIKESTYISKYYSALPSNSYHATIFNIWCHGQKLLPLQIEWLSEVEKRIRRSIQDDFNYKMRFPHRESPAPIIPFEKFKREYIVFAKGEESVSFANMTEFLPLMSNIDELCKSRHNKEYDAKISERGISGCFVHFDEENEKKLISLRKEIGQLVGHYDTGLVPHITFAYKYRDILEEDKESLDKEMKEFIELVKTLTTDGIKLSAPRATWFRNMLSYLTIEDMYP